MGCLLISLQSPATQIFWRMPRLIFSYICVLTGKSYKHNLIQSRATRQEFETKLFSAAAIAYFQRDNVVCELQIVGVGDNAMEMCGSTALSSPGVEVREVL